MNYDIALSWKGKGFGEPLVLAMLTNVLVDNGINAAWCPKGKAKSWMVTCPIFNKGIDISNSMLNGTYEHSNTPIIIQHLNKLERMTGKFLRVDYNYIPVNFEEEDVPIVDVLMCTDAGDYTPYKEWPWFYKLKSMLFENGISFADIHKDKLWGMTCLNYAKKCKLYLGLDTGVSHYVSKFTNGKTLIIQSGYVTFNYWAHLYDFDHISIDLPCVPCFKSKHDVANGNGCKLDNACMKLITPEIVFERIKECLK